MSAIDGLTRALADRYRIDREIGQGGMATVYVARDLKHDRDVAIKVLKPELGAVLGAERFLAEIKTTAKLQHPHILPLLDSGEASGLVFYVMPFIEGESLRARLERERQLPIPEAVRLAREVASALDYAHRHGVIHRDIKPENVLLHDGQALVADFGIALAVQSAGGERMTQTGLSLGTPQYMSPEQAMGEKVVDARSDIYALGAMTYEMLAGDPPFTGSSAQAIVAKVLSERPTPLTTLRDTVSPAVAHAVHTALAKLAADRFATAREFADALEGKGATESVATSAIIAPRTARARLRDPVVLALCLFAVGATAVATWQWSAAHRVVDAPVIRVLMEIPRYVSSGASIGSAVAIGPDGTTIAYISGTSDASSQQIVIRTLDSVRSLPVPGTEFAQSLFLSPDGKWLGYWAKGHLYKLALAGGAPLRLVTTVSFNGASWARDGQIVASLNYRLVSLADTGGGTATPLGGAAANPNGSETHPVVLDDGETVLYIADADSTGDRSAIAAASLSTGRRTPLGIAGTFVVGMVDGFLVYTTATNQLMAAPFDVQKLRVGTPVQIGVTSAGIGSQKPMIALSRTGTLAYTIGTRTSELVRVDTRGSVSKLRNESRAYGYPRFSPDGRRLALSVGTGNDSDVWLYDLAAQTLTRFTEDGTSGRPEWTPDGTRVIYRARSNSSPSTIWWRPTDMSTAPTPMFGPNASNVGGLWEGVMTPDARGGIVQRDGTIGTGADIVYRPIVGDTTPVQVSTMRGDETQARPSPDGRWMAFQLSDADGTSQVIVKALQGPGAQVVVSTGFGTEPVWSRDRKRLFYRDGQQFVEVTYTAAPDFRIVSRTPLFADQFLLAAAPHANYDVYPDGSGFVALRETEGQQLIIAYNWRAELQRQMAAQERK